MNKLKVIDILNKDPDMKYLYNEVNSITTIIYKVLTDDYQGRFLEKGANLLQFLKNYIELSFDLNLGTILTDDEIASKLKDSLFAYVSLGMICKSIKKLDPTIELKGNEFKDALVDCPVLLGVYHMEKPMATVHLIYKDIKITIEAEKDAEDSMYFTFENVDASAKSRMGKRYWGRRYELNTLTATKFIDALDDTLNL